MYIIPAGSPNQFDVFLGHGWDNWSRVQVTPEGSVSTIRGIRLKPSFLVHVQNVIGSIFYSDLRAKKRK